jgi:hypothetical protein
LYKRKTKLLGKRVRELELEQQRRELEAIDEQLQLVDRIAGPETPALPDLPALQPWKRARKLPASQSPSDTEP